MPRLKPRKSLRKGKKKRCEHMRRRQWLVRALVTRSRGQCRYCGKAVGRDQITIDHIVPTASGGLDRLDNLVLACARCNREKGRGVTIDVFIEPEEDP